MRRASDPGTALVAEIAGHWRITPPTARRILAAAGLNPVGDGWERYRWTEIWRFEKAGFVPACDYADFKSPLLTPSELPERDARGRAPRTMRRYLKSGRLPAIRLSPTVVRIRACDFDAAIPYV